MKYFLKQIFDTLRAMFYVLLMVISIMGFITMFRSVDDSSCVLVTTTIVSFIGVMYGAKNLIRVLKEID